MAEMVWCNSCKTVVWAYDHYPHTDIRGFLNLAKIPCPLCDEKGNFDGWGSDKAYEDVKPVAVNFPVFDDWSAMKFIAHTHKMEWNPSPNNHWFRY